MLETAPNPSATTIDAHIPSSLKKIGKTITKIERTAIKYKNAI